MEVGKKNAIKLCSAIWFVVGSFLLWKGLFLLAGNLQLLEMKSLPILRFVARYTRDLEQSVMTLIAAGLLLGFIKGRLALKRVVKRTTDRMRERVALRDLFARRDFILIGFMMLLGMSMRFLPIPIDVRGFVDVVVGSGLINGAMLFVRQLIYDKADSR